MAITSYNYNVTDTANDEVAISVLTQEIGSSSMGSLFLDVTFGAVPAFSGQEPTTFVVRTDPALSAAEKSVLDAVVAAHQGLDPVGDDNIQVDETQDLNGNDLVGVANINGVDFTAFSTATNTHIADLANPHETDFGSLKSDTLANLNAAISDANVDDASSPRDPNTHASTHGASGADPINHNDLAGLTSGDPHTQYLTPGRFDTRLSTKTTDDLAEGLTNRYFTQASVSSNPDVSANSTHRGRTDNPHGTDVGNLGQGTLAELNAVISDANLDASNSARPPLAHASTHSASGADPISHNNLAGLTTGDPHSQYTTEPRAREAAPVQPTSGQPANTEGQDGDLAIDPQGAVLYEKTSGVWSQADDLQGPQGDTGFGLGAFARTLSNGTLVESRGLTVSRVSAGRYQYTLTQAAANSDYGVYAQPIGTNTDTNTQVQQASITPTGFVVEIGEGDNSTSADVLTDTEHAVFVFGTGVQGPFGITSAYESWLASGNTGTEADFIASLVGPQGPGVPTGGTAGQVLVKQSGTDFDTSFETLEASDVGADPAGTAAAAVAAHEAASDPHPQYTTTSEASAAAPVQIVNGQSGTVTLDTDDVPEGSGNLYFNQALVSSNADVSANNTHRSRTDNPHGTTAAQVGAVPTTEKSQPNGVATLDGSGKIPTSQIPASALPSFDVVADLAARDALTVQEGDEAFVQSENRQYIYDGSAWFERPQATGSVVGPASSIDNSIPRYDGTTGKVIQGSQVFVTDSGDIGTAGSVTASGIFSNGNVSITGDVAVSGLVDGVDLAALSTTTTDHIADQANPHGTSIANIDQGTLAQLNAKLTDATLDDASGKRDPNSHAATHAQDGSDELTVQDLGSGSANAGQRFETDGSGGVILVTPQSVVTDHGQLSGLSDDDHTQYLREDGQRAMSGNLNMGSQDIINVGDVDGVDVSVLSSTTTGHIADQANPHDTSIANINQGTLAQLNTKITNATLDDASSPRDPSIHASTHAQGGSDELTAQDLGSGAAPSGRVLETDGSGGFNLITTPQDTSDHGQLSGLGDDDHLQYFHVDGRRSLTGNLDAGGNNIINVGDVDGVDVSALSSTTTSHINNQSNPHGTDLGNLGQGTLAQLNAVLSDGTLDVTGTARPPTVHASTHEAGGSDPLLIQSLSSGAVPSGQVFQSDGAGGVTPVAIEALDRMPSISLFNINNGSAFTNTFAPVVLNGEAIKDSDYFTHGAISAEVTILVGGVYEITAYGTPDQTTTNKRTECEHRVTLDDGSGFALIPGMFARTYHRQASQGSTAFLVTQVRSFDAGDVVRIESRRTSGTATIVPLANAYGMTIRFNQGLKGEKGDTGAGSSIELREDGAALGGNPFSALDFVGQNITLSDQGSGVAQLVVSGAPTQHASTHQQGGSDPLNVQDLGSGSAATGALFTSDGLGGVSVTDGLVLQDQSSAGAPAGQILETDGSGGFVLLDTPSNTFVPRSTELFADQLDTPGTLSGNDWAVNNGAGASADVITPSLVIRRFDDTNPEGVGWTHLVEDQSSTLTLRLRSRAQSAPTQSRVVKLDLYFRAISIDGSAPPSTWQSIRLDDVLVPTSTNFIQSVFNINLAIAGISSGTLYQFELVRAAAEVGDNLPGDWVLASIFTRFDRGGEVTASFGAMGFQNPTNADWAVPEVAIPIADPANSSLLVRAFDDSTEEGVGWVQRVPSSASSMSMVLVARAQSLTGSSQARFRLRARRIPFNGSPAPWQTPVDLGNIALSGENFATLTSSVPLAIGAIEPGGLYIFELTRDASNASDTLAGDCLLLLAETRFP